MGTINKKLAVAAGEPPKNTPNPWDAAHWNLTKQMAFAKQFGMEVAREWAASVGTTIGGPKPKPKAQAGTPGPMGQRGARGASADSLSFNGWSPLLAVVADGARAVLQVEDWEGGSGDKPVSGDYLGVTGLVGDIAAASDIRGPAGANGTTADTALIRLEFADPSEGEIVMGIFTTDEVQIVVENVQGTGPTLTLWYSTDGVTYREWGDVAIANTGDWSPVDGTIIVRGMRSGFLYLVSDLLAQDNSEPAIRPGIQGHARAGRSVIKLKLTSPYGTIFAGTSTVNTPGGEGDPPPSFYRITQFDERRITELGEPRILEIAP